MRGASALTRANAHTNKHTQREASAPLTVQQALDDDDDVRLMAESLEKARQAFVGFSAASHGEEVKEEEEEGQGIEEGREEESVGLSADELQQLMKSGTVVGDASTSASVQVSDLDAKISDLHKVKEGGKAGGRGRAWEGVKGGGGRGR